MCTTTWEDQPYKYLPYPSTTNDGKVKPTAFTEQKGFMQSQFAGEQVYYSQTLFENSPLSRVKKAMAAGNSFAGSNRGTEIKQEANVANEVIVWTINAATGSIPATAGYYDASSLYRGTIVDPHGKRVVEYKDKEGRLILKKVEVKHDGLANITGYPGWLCTYYVYDDVSNARFTITPRAVEWLITNNWVQMTPAIVRTTLLHLRL